jgi:hypothetical protein
MAPGNTVSCVVKHSTCQACATLTRTRCLHTLVRLVQGPHTMINELVALGFLFGIIAFVMKNS